MEITKDEALILLRAMRANQASMATGNADLDMSFEFYALLAKLAQFLK